MSLPDLYDAAMHLARQGFRVHPLKPGQKTPQLNAWQKQATTDFGQIDIWWKNNRTANIGIACGGGFFVLDEDPRHGSDEAIAMLELAYGELPPTRTVLTPSGGKHRYYRTPAGVIVKNSASKIGAGLDIRGEGGYVVSSPSALVAGEKQTAGHYVNDGAIQMVQAPQWLRDLVMSEPVKPLYTEPPAPIGATFDEMRKLLAGEKGYDKQDEWLRVGMAIHHETQASEEGFALWCQWSKQWDKYPGAEAIRPRWNSFRIDAANPVTLGGLRRDAIADTAEFPLIAPTEHQAVDTGTDTRPAAIIKRLLEPRLVLVTGQSAYFDLESNNGELLSAFTVQHTFCPLLPVIRTETKTGVKITKIDPIEYLKESKTKQVVSNVGLHPGEGRFFEEDNRRFVNRYSPPNIELKRPMPRELDAFNFMWSRIQDPVLQKWLKQFFAHALQKPGVKIRTAPLLWSEQTGTGKNTIMRELPGRLFGEKWISDMTGGVLNSQFNDQLGETWWLYLDELRAGTNKSERIATTNRIKSWITDNTIQIHPKGRKPYSIRNRLQLTASSNFDDAIQIDNHDRRWAIGEILGTPLRDDESLNLYDFLNSDRAPGVLRTIFYDVSLTGFRPDGRAPDTVAKKVMIQAGLGNAESLLVEKIMSGANPFHRDVFELSEVTPFLSAHALSHHRVAKILQRAPFYCEPLGVSGGTRHWAWRNIELWRGVSPSARTEYMNGTGSRPPGLPWSDAIPKSIVEMASEEVASEPEIPDSCKGLL